MLALAAAQRHRAGKAHAEHRHGDGLGKFVGGDEINKERFRGAPGQVVKARVLEIENGGIGAGDFGAFEPDGHIQSIQAGSQCGEIQGEPILDGDDAEVGRPAPEG